MRLFEFRVGGGQMGTRNATGDKHTDDSKKAKAWLRDPASWLHLAMVGASSRNLAFTFFDMFVTRQHSELFGGLFHKIGLY